MRAQVRGVGLEYSVHGRGEPLLLVHGALLADGLAPLLAEPALQAYQKIVVHRRGFARSDHTALPVAVAEHAADCLALLEHLSIESAHVAGHSLGALIALEMACAQPVRVRSLGLIEPSNMADAPSTPQVLEAAAPVLQTYQAGDKGRAVHMFLEFVGQIGPRYQDVIEKALPAGALAQAVEDADTFFQSDLPGFAGYKLAPETARAIHQPAVVLAGAASYPVFQECGQAVLSRLPQARRHEVAGTTHLMQVMSPRPVAEALGSLFSAHPLSPPPGL